MKRPEMRPPMRPKVRPEMRPRMRPLTDEEGEVRELTEEDFKSMRPIAEVDPGMLKAVAEWRRKGGRPKSEAPKVHIGFRLAANLVASIKATGKGYNARVKKALSEAFMKIEPASSAAWTNPDSKGATASTKLDNLRAAASRYVGSELGLAAEHLTTTAEAEDLNVLRGAIIHVARRLENMQALLGRAEFLEGAEHERAKGELSAEEADILAAWKEIMATEARAKPEPTAEPAAARRWA
jgi:uncharacterized protein (DUF4415 family)